MAEVFNIYCDESCHLQNDNIKPMVLGAIWCPQDKVKEINKRLREIKSKYYNNKYELKWSKISRSEINLYIDIINYFFDDDDLHFRGVVIPDKTQLRHDRYKQNHDTWYYKMLFVLLKVIFDPREKYCIYLDYKDTQGNIKLEKLHEVLCNNIYDFSKEIIVKTQLVKSHQVELIQLADVIIGALSYFHRKLNTNEGKLKIIDKIIERSGYSLSNNTLYKEQKINLLIWKPQEPEE